MENSISYTVVKNIKETHDVHTLHIKPNSDLFSYGPGQFITIYFPETGTPEGKAYSLSSAPHEDAIMITVKRMGEFSNLLCDMKEGNRFSGSLPYGFFSSEYEQVPLIAVAAGIGITPFRCLILDQLERQPDRPIYIFYSNKTTDDIVFEKEFDQLQFTHPRIKIYYFITRQKSGLLPDFHTERISGEFILKKIGEDFPLKQQKEFLLCGSISFVRDLWKSLHDLGVPQDQLYTEAFFSH